MYKLSDEIMLTEVDNELILLDLNSGEFYGLNEMAKIVWKLIDEGSSAEEIIQHIVESSADKLDKSKIQNDVEEFIAELVNIGLIIES